jgi:hypothetical protein
MNFLMTQLPFRRREDRLVRLRERHAASAAKKVASRLAASRTDAIGRRRGLLIPGKYREGRDGCKNPGRQLRWRRTLVHNNPRQNRLRTRAGFAATVLRVSGTARPDKVIAGFHLFRAPPLVCLVCNNCND